ncbi:hypothetical protein [Chryseobacterium sp. WLY505]|nr:hypothetical protein [Chryseobacterium sp. WLY505]MDQ1858286.1 hypothetical protein [Chryseobacterium sp. WLY505]
MDTFLDRNLNALEFYKRDSENVQG